MRWWVHGDPLKVVTPRRETHDRRPPYHPPGAAHPSWQGDNISYMTAHKRIMKLRGKASDYPCVRCHGDAAEWAYLHTDPQVKRDATGSYSTDPEHYAPMCVRCHRRFDRSHSGDV